jgi:hypothetical protein
MENKMIDTINTIPFFFIGDIATIIIYALYIVYEYWFVILVVSYSIYGNQQARKKLSEQERAARDAYNASLKDRAATKIASEAPHVYVYGRARVGSAIVAMFTSGKRDEYKHLVCVHAAHECDAYEEIYINGKALGNLDVDGYAINSTDYTVNGTTTIHQEPYYGIDFYLSNTPISGTVRVSYPGYDFEGNPQDKGVIFSITGTHITITGSYYIPNYSGGDPILVTAFNVSYDTDSTVHYVRVKKHLGVTGDAADAQLILDTATLTDKWTSTCTLDGFCYSVVTLNLNQREFQGGVPSIEVLLRGKKLHDVRSGSYPLDTPVWSQNNTLMIADYLTSEMCNVPLTDLPLADFVASANVCDETNAHGVRYQANGTVTSDQNQGQVLEAMAQSMAGSIVSTTWGITAGKYIAPVMALTQSDIVGDMSYAPGTPEADLFNGVKGQYISTANTYVVTDFQPYQNTAYVTSDGSELWTNIDFMFTDDKQRVHDLCRIYTEDQRNGFTLKGSFSYKTWDLQVGDRVTFTSTLMGQTSKVYRVMDKSFAADKAVDLILKEDVSTIWDLSDAVTVDSTPNTNLPNPFSVGVCGNLSVLETLYQTTGSVGVRSKATFSWTAPTDISVIHYEAEYKPFSSGTWVEFPNITGTSFDFLDLAPGQYDCRVRATNIFNITGPYTSYYTFTVYGLTSAPENVSGFSIAPMGGVAYGTWTKTTSLDVKIGGKIVIRFCPLTTGATWEQSYIMEEFNGDSVNGTLPLATGTYYAKFIDSTGHYSATETAFVATEALVTGWTTVTTTTQHTAFAGAKTQVYVDSGTLKLTGSTLWDDLGLIDDLGFVDTIGGVASSGTYLFDATLDLTTAAARRYHAHITSFSYDTGDTISQRGLVSTWPSVSGGVINDCDITVSARVSNDNITYGPWTPFMVADFNCRYAQFKAELTSQINTHNIQINELSVAVKIPV